jgi:hypothetical protein
MKLFDFTDMSPKRYVLQLCIIFIATVVATVVLTFGVVLIGDTVAYAQAPAPAQPAQAQPPVNAPPPPPMPSTRSKVKPATPTVQPQAQPATGAPTTAPTPAPRSQPPARRQNGNGAAVIPANRPTSFYWDQQAPSLADANGYSYKFFIDSGTDFTALQSNCTGQQSPFICSTGVPALTPGNHRVMVQASQNDMDSDMSNPLDFVVGIAPGNPSGLRFNP